MLCCTRIFLTGCTLRLAKADDRAGLMFLNQSNPLERTESYKIQQQRKILAFRCMLRALFHTSHRLLRPERLSGSLRSLPELKVKPIILVQPGRQSFRTSAYSFKARSRVMSSPVMLEPPVHREMTFETFDKDAFKLNINLLAAKVPSSQIGKLKKELARYAVYTIPHLTQTLILRQISSVLAIPRVASIVADPDSKDLKLLLLNKASKG